MGPHIGRAFQKNRYRDYCTVPTRALLRQSIAADDFLFEYVFFSPGLTAGCSA
jgi:hypothetical protein